MENFIQSIQRIRMKAEVKKKMNVSAHEEGSRGRQVGRDNSSPLLPNCLIFMVPGCFVFQGLLCLTGFSHMVLFVTSFCSVYPLITVSVVTSKVQFLPSFPFPSYMSSASPSFSLSGWSTSFLGWTYFLWTVIDFIDSANIFDSFWVPCTLRVQDILPRLYKYFCIYLCETPSTFLSSRINDYSETYIYKLP